MISTKRVFMMVLLIALFVAIAHCYADPNPDALPHRGGGYRRGGGFIVAGGGYRRGGFGGGFGGHGHHGHHHGFHGGHHGRRHYG